MSRNNTRISILTFALGAGAGAVIGLLLASKTGKQFREDISGKVKRLKGKAETFVADAKDRIDDVTSEVAQSRP